jgi:hypothetical protein
MPDLPQTKEELDRYIEDALRLALDCYLPSEQTLESLHAGLEKAIGPLVPAADA